ncbi:DegV family protein [Ureaplasma miroungigenitalium]|uniref:DegV family protein n=1 Tax=Ureaplasma miroungigenitalium TaxID=1042321 RepID=A0ABT3BN47_9BACT|nr:DegV family protein [Ureaplasma miroungigenitalium]MCV3728653.1 DegV family protein [Ureaplasma miroungigenitalium]MCV3734344.1 DegV family protein [Ureaplasma miroungigenitalium]
MRTAILIDSGANVLDLEHPDVYFIPIGLTIRNRSTGEENVYDDVLDVSQDQMRNALIAKHDIKTNYPSTGKVINKLETLFLEYERVIVLTLSSGLSGFFASFHTTKKHFENNNLLVIDSKAVSIGILWLVEDILKLLQNNTNISNETIQNYVETQTQRIVGSVIVADLTQLINGGRLSRMKGLIASTLKLKLVIKWNYKLEYADKSLSFANAIDKALNIIDNENAWRTKGIKRIALLTDLENNEQLGTLRKLVTDKLGQNVELIKSYLPGCIYAHVGINNFAIMIEANE